MLTTVGWWASADDVTTTAPTASVNLNTIPYMYNNLSVDPAAFAGYTGSWYVVNSSLRGIEPPVFMVAAPDPLDAPVIQAVNAVVAQELHGNTTGVEVSAYPHVVDKPEVQFYWGQPEHTFNTAQCALTVIDHGPNANGERPMTYLCVDVNDNTKVEKWDTMAPSTNYAVTHAAGEGSNPGEIWIPHDPDAWEPACKEDCSKYYAVLISGGTSNTLNYIRYWNDIAFMYITLIEYGYLPSHIKVLMSDGAGTGTDRCIATSGPLIQYDSSPQNLDGMGGNEVITAVTKVNVTAELNRLRSTLTATDNLFIFTTGHGGGDSSSNSRLMLWNNEQITDDEFFAQLITGDTNGVPSLTMVMEQCNGGGFNDEFITGSAKRILMTAASPTEPSYANGFSDAWTKGVAGHLRYSSTADPKWDRGADTTPVINESRCLRPSPMRKRKIPMP